MSNDVVQKITFIGGGHIACAMISGLVAAGYDSKSIVVSNPSKEKRLALEEKCQIQTRKDNVEAICGANVIILAVKPAQIKTVCEQIACHIKNDVVVVSVAAGVEMQALKRVLAGHSLIARAMPNMAASVRQSATAVFSPSLPSRYADRVEALFSLMGKVVWLSKEEELSIVTALAGSGPAYFFLMVELMVKAAMGLGLPESVATELATQTALGAGQMMMLSSEDSNTLRSSVTSSKGTTEAAIDTMMARGFDSIMTAALTAAYRRALELTIE